VIERNLLPVLREAAGLYPVVTLTGPRQSGKTTLCRLAFPRKRYVSLEPLDVRSYATTDPRGFLSDYQAGAVIDEVQNVPALLSYLQTEVDARPSRGRFVLTGSQNFALMETVTQSLAGRTAVLHLLAPGYDELLRFPAPPRTLLETLWNGAYPRIHDQGIPADRWLSDYFTTYVQRDVRSVLGITNLSTFTSFMRLLAGRTGQVLNLSSLGADAGVSHNTAKAWLSVLEASFLVLRLPAWQRNLNKQVTRSPKIHFLDSGLVCHLLGIRKPEQLRNHPLRGAIFESWVVAEACKARLHRGLPPDLFHFRDHKGQEIDLVMETGPRLVLTEIKSGATVHAEMFSSLEKISTLAAAKGGPKTIELQLVHGGLVEQQRSSVHVVPWNMASTLGWER
jgi:uncharacterized protein